MGHFATFCLLALDGPPRGLRPTINLLAALCPLTLIWIDWPCYGLIGPNYASGPFYLVGRFAAIFPNVLFGRFAAFDPIMGCFAFFALLACFN